MRKPSIPQVPRVSDDRGRFDSSLKESLEVMMGRRGTKLVALDTTTATTAQIAAKVNEIIEALQ